MSLGLSDAVSITWFRTRCGLLYFIKIQESVNGSTVKWLKCIRVESERVNKMCTDEWSREWTSGRTSGRASGRVDVRVDGRVDVRVDGRVDKWICEGTCEWMARNCKGSGTRIQNRQVVMKVFTE